MKRVVSGIDEQKFAAIAAEIRRRLGAELPAPSGSIEAQGFTFQVQYDREAETLTLDLLKKPWFIPDSLVAQKIDEWLAGSGAVSQAG
jgi:hypothetical protein